MKIVVKLGGRVQSDPQLACEVKSLWQRASGSLCIVHGGGDEVTLLQRQLGREPAFLNGRRITTVEDLALVRMVLSGSANKRLVSALSAEGIPAVGISGEDGSLLSAEPIDVAQLGRAGSPLPPNPRIIETLMENGFLPVVSPVATDATSTTGEAINVNGDDAAAAIAASLGAELWMIADVAGVLDGNRSVVHELDQAETQSLVESGTVNRGMLAKLEAGFAALNAGSPVVRIASVEAFSDPQAGTFLTLSPSMR